MVIEKPLVGLIMAGTAGGLASIDFGNPANVVLQFGSFGVLCFLVLHIFRHTIPRLASAFDTNLKESREAFTEQLTIMQDTFNEMLTAQRTDFRDEMRLERASTEHKIEELTTLVLRQVTSDHEGAPS